MGTKEIFISPGTVTLTVEYPRTTIVEDPRQRRNMRRPKMGTQGCAEYFKSFVLDMIDDTDKRKRAEEYMDSYYHMRLLHEAGIEKTPVFVKNPEE